MKHEERVSYDYVIELYQDCWSHGRPGWTMIEITEDRNKAIEIARKEAECEGSKYSVRIVPVLIVGDRRSMETIRLNAEYKKHPEMFQSIEDDDLPF